MEIVRGIPIYFFDDTVIAHHQRVVRRWLPAKVFPEPMIKPDREWEERILAFHGTVLPEPEGGYRMYYAGFAPGHGCTKIYLARSKDGFSWVKPELGLVDWHGSRANNIVISASHNTDSPSFIFDPDDSKYPYKMFWYRTIDMNGEPNSGLYAAKSKDGLTFEHIPGMRLRAGDRTNMMASKHNGKFIVYTRHTDMFKQVGCRAIYYSESKDFLDWTELELVLSPDLTDEADVEFYGISVFKHNGIFFGLLEYWHSDTDVLEVHLAISSDGKKWFRPQPHVPFIGHSYPWNCTWSSCASNGPIIINEQMVFYFHYNFSALPDFLF